MLQVTKNFPASTSTCLNNIQGIFWGFHSSDDSSQGLGCDAV
jgi:hypothetical protein